MTMTDLLIAFILFYPPLHLKVIDENFLSLLALSASIYTIHPYL